MEVPLIASIGFVVVLIVVLLRLFSAGIYDVVIVWMTARWYAAVFEKLRKGSRVLDVGIGTATALVKNKEKLLEKRLSVVGFDYEAAYVRKAESVLRTAGLWKPVPEGTDGYRNGEYYCRVYQRSIYDDDLVDLCRHSNGDGAKSSDSPVPEDDRFDAAYFSGSLTLMPDPPGALQAVIPMLKRDGGLVYITQTFQKQHSSFMAVVKPLLRYLTTIDFGQLTTEERLKEIITEAKDFEVVENSPIPGSVDNSMQVARLIILRPKK